MNLAALFTAPLSVQMHIYAALAAAVLGLVQFAGRKGIVPHRALGWVLVAAMAVTALSSVAMIGTCVVPGVSPIHLITAYTLLMLPLAVLHARRHRIADHRSAMLWLYGGGIVIAGALTLAPGRLLHDIAFRRTIVRSACAVPV